MNKSNNITKFSQGFSLIEMMITLMLSSSITVGMMYIYLSITLFIEKDLMEEDVQHYVSHIYELISEDIFDADSIRIENILGNNRLVILNTDHQNIIYSFDDESIIITGDATEISNPENDNVFIASDYDLFENKKYDVTFDFIPSDNVLTNSDTGVTMLRNNVYEVEIQVEVEGNSDFNNYNRIFNYKRRFFAQNNFILHRNNI